MSYTLRWAGRLRTTLFGSAVLLALVNPQSLSAQSYSIDWYTIDGGGYSASGAYSITGTVGQPDAGSMRGGNFSLTGGFWSVVGVVQTETAPPLHIIYSTTNTVVVYWSLPDTGWRLQYTLNLSTSPIVWTEIPPPYLANATSLYHLEPIPAGNKFYRLHKP
jgi:hypothetical protein